MTEKGFEYEIKMKPLTFQTFADANRRRCTTIFKQALTDWSPMEWGSALSGEVGELWEEIIGLAGYVTARVGGLNNMLKKLSRLEQKIEISKMRDIRVTQDKVMGEIGDVGIYLDLLAQRCGTTLEDCIRQSFNRKSAEMGTDIFV